MMDGGNPSLVWDESGAQLRALMNYSRQKKTKQESLDSIESVICRNVKPKPDFQDGSPVISLKFHTPKGF